MIIVRSPLRITLVVGARICPPTIETTAALSSRCHRQVRLRLGNSPVHARIFLKYSHLEHVDRVGRRATSHHARDLAFDGARSLADRDHHAG